MCVCVSGCRGEWDNVSCWQSAAVGEVMTLPCPSPFLHLFGKHGESSSPPSSIPVISDATVHIWTPLDTTGHQWTFVDTSGHQWTLVDISGHQWTLVDYWGICKIVSLTGKREQEVEDIWGSGSLGMLENDAQIRLLF